MIPEPSEAIVGYRTIVHKALNNKKYWTLSIELNRLAVITRAAPGAGPTFPPRPCRRVLNNPPHRPPISRRGGAARSFRQARFAQVVRERIGVPAIHIRCPFQPGREGECRIDAPRLGKDAKGSICLLAAPIPQPLPERPPGKDAAMHTKLDRSPLAGQLAPREFIRDGLDCATPPL